MTAIQIWELFGSRDSLNAADGADTTTLKFALAGSNDEEALKNALTLATRPERNGLLRGDISVTQLAPTLWEGTVEYDTSDTEKKEKPKIGESEISFDTTGGTTHIQQSLATKKYARPGTKAEDFKGAINVTGEGKDMKVEGVDIVIPALKFTETHWVPRAFVNLEYINTLYRLTGKTNDKVWRRFLAGELLFAGARGSARGREAYQIAYDFIGSENVEKLKVDKITNIKKGGHEYLWPRYRLEDVDDSGEPIDPQQVQPESEGVTSGFTVPRAVAVYVEKVYHSADFTQLGIGN